MLKFLLEKEFKQMRRNKVLPRLIVMFPIVMMLIMPHAMNMEVKHINVTIVDSDKSTYSNWFSQKIEASEYFTLQGSYNSYAEALDILERGEADVIVEIPYNFEQDLVNIRIANTQISINAVNGIKGGLSSSYMNYVITQFSNQIREHNDEATLPNIQLNVIDKYRYNIFQDYLLYMVPALMVMILTLLSGFLPALNIVLEKENGTIEQINVSPVGKFMFVFSKMLPYWLVGIVVFSLSLLVAYFAYGIKPVGSILDIYITVVIYIITVSSLGLLISNYSSTMQQAMFLTYFFIMIFILLSGLFTPVTSMPDWVQAITYINPLRYFIDLIRGIVIQGNSLKNMSSMIILLSIYAAVAASWAVISYRKRA